jgi:hypothetical protein
VRCTGLKQSLEYQRRVSRLITNRHGGLASVTEFVANRSVLGPSPYLKIPPNAGVLRIGVLLDSNALGVRDAQLLSDLFAAEHVKVAAIVVGRRASQSIAHTTTFLGRRLVRAYEFIDRQWHGSEPTESVDLSTLVGPAGRAALISGANLSDAELVAELSSRDLDVILCCRPFNGMRQFAVCARHGIWWVAATPELTREPEYLRDLAIAAAGEGPQYSVLWTLAAGDPEAVPIAFGSTRLASIISVFKNREPLYPIRRNLWLSGLRTLLLRTWKQQRLGSGAIRVALDRDFAKARWPSTAGIVTIGTALTKMGARFVRHQIRTRNRVEQWQVGVRPRAADDARLFDTDGYEWISAPRHHWYADPFLFRAANAEYLFMEDFDERRGIGSIVCGKLSSDGRVSDIRVVLERGYHLSYPHVFEHAGQIYMIPESGGNNTVELYRAVAFPWEWEFLKVLYEGQAFDTTMLYHEGRFWFLSTLVEDAGRLSNQLLLFYSDRIDGDWIMHPANPISNDASFARNAGGIFRLGGDLVRVAQDGHRIYGGAVRFYRIDVLSTEEYVETEIGVITPTKIANGLGVHTYNRSDSMEVIDVLMSKFN